MNKYEKQIEVLSLKDEKDVLNELSRQYKEAMGNIKEKVAELEKRLGETTDESIRRSITYQLNYQKALQGQIGGILDTLQSENFNTIQDFLKKSYETGFIGTMYDMQGQGIPLILPIDQNKMIKAIMIDSKISEDLYTSLGNNIKDLKNEIRREITRGLANNYSYSQIAQLIDIRGDVSKNKAYRIARTEGHRVQQEATFDAQVQAKKEGADVVKQWVAITDNRTREAHAELDGKIVEVEKPFEYGGHKALYPGGFGVAALDINCRCRIVQRAKWALDEEELARLEERAKKFDLDKTKDFEDFKKKYLGAVEEIKENENLYNFTKEQSKSIEWYVSGEGQWVNQYLRGRGDFGNLTDFEKEALNSLTEATNRMLPSDVKQLFRSVDAKAIFGDVDSIDWDNFEQYIKYGENTFGKGAYAENIKRKAQELLEKTKGKTIIEKGFMSTSKNYEVVAEWGDYTGSERPIIIEFVEIPKGIKGADLKSFDVEGEEQYEVLLARNTKYEIIDIYGKDGYIVLKAKFIND